ncbi:MAG: flagellar motor protein MotB [Pseudomonadota bacterium]|nr:flagellar motor protein MotB [Pseudomonadota bacterium]
MGSTPHNIIIKRVKKVSDGGHHGGAWKVAYADFVTAMMAFFLLMWLLNATTEDQRKGIADYFNPSIPISQVSGGGADVLEGSSVFVEDELARQGHGGRQTQPEEVSVKAEEKTDVEKRADDGALKAVGADLLKRAMEEEGDILARHIQTRMTPDGLVIELVEVDGSPLFEVGSSRPSPTMVKLLQVVAGAVAQVANNVAIVGHTDSRPYSGDRNYTNWELSTDRANTARRLMVASGMGVSQVAEVSGKADTEPLTPDPLAPQNRRISITLLRD